MKKINIRNRFTEEVIFTYESENNTIKETVEKANLRDADLRNANLRDADLRDANLRYANLRYADLRYADLINVNLEDAYLRDVDLRDANLRDANLRNADLINVNLEDAKNYYSFFAYDTSRRIVHCIKHKEKWMIKAGCFWGSLEELEEKVKATHNSKVYLANIEILKSL